MKKKKRKIYLFITVITCILICPIVDFDSDQVKPISLNIDKIIEVSADQSLWPQSVTGVWGDAVATSEVDSGTGYLVLSEQNGEIKGVSTTGKSLWTGTFRHGVIIADYAKEGIIRGSLQLRLSADGSSLQGTWNNSGISGTYSAYRTAHTDKTLLREHLHDRMGNWVKLTDQL